MHALMIALERRHILTGVLGTSVSVSSFLASFLGHLTAIGQLVIVVFGAATAVLTFAVQLRAWQTGRAQKSPKQNP